MKKFEYLSTPYDSIDLSFQDWLNEKGSEGWELTGVWSDRNYIFKRELK